MSTSRKKAMATHGGEVFRLAAEFGLEPEKIIDFSANINPLGLPCGVDSALHKALQNLANYPEIGAESLRLRLAERHKLGVENVIVGNGSSALIYLLSRAFKPKKALILAPTFTEYERALRLVNSEVFNLICLVPEKNISLKEIIKAITEKQPELVFLCNPNNPTGDLWSVWELEEIVTALSRAGIICILDEAFIDFVGSESSLATRVEKFDNLIILRSLTKIYALAGIRCGYLLCNRSLNRLLSRFLEPWSVNSLALGAAAAALENDQDFIQETIAFVTRERKFLSEKLSQFIFIKPFPATANYILVQVDSSVDCGKLSEYLFIRSKILIRRCGDYIGLDDNYVRFAVKKEGENRKLLEALSVFQDTLIEKRD